MRIVAPRLQVAYALFRVVEDDAHREPLARANATDAMAHGNFSDAVLTDDGPLIDGEHNRITLIQRDDVGALTVRARLRHDKIAADEVLAGVR